MKGQSLTILFDGDKAYLTPDVPLRLEQLGIDGRFDGPAFWEVVVHKHFQEERRIFCEIQRYQTGETEFGEAQMSLVDVLSQLEIVSFKSIDTASMLKSMAGEKPIIKAKAEPENRPRGFVRPRVPVKETLNLTFSTLLKDARFKLGGVTVQKHIADLGETIEMTIPNYNIREEFDAVKNYFANVLKTKRIKVAAKIELLDGQVMTVDAKSPEIEKIGQELIDNVRFEFVKDTTKKKIKVEVEKSLFTMDEYFDNFAEEGFKSNTFHKNERELFEDILRVSNTKHYKQLRYLSSIHAYTLMKLRFVHKPFSFVFLIEGERNYHIVWETLDTEEATYVWHIRKDIGELKRSLRKIEDIINVIKVQGKTAYINSADEPYQRIFHDYSSLVDGFVRWKGELEAVLT